jgi:hypothetical protein
VSIVPRGSLTHPIGLRLKQLVLLFGAAYLGIVTLTNLVNVLVSIADGHLTFLNSGNVDYVENFGFHAYGWPHALAILAVLVATVIEGIGCWLFVRALRAYIGGGAGTVQAYHALAWNVAVWLAFILGSEFFLAYAEESVFRELLAVSLLMVVVIAVVPDEVN